MGVKRRKQRTGRRGCGRYVLSGARLTRCIEDQAGTREIEERTRRMNVALHRTTLLACVLAGALALAIALVAA